MQTFALKLEYDGAAFGGSQYQANARSVQGALEAALASLGLCGRVALAGRTDAGVHAEGQVAAATLVRPWAASDLQCAINARLPEDAAVVAAAVAPEGFDPRRWAVSRRYRYRMLIGSVRSPLRRRHAWHVRYEVDEEAMRTAASALVGEHDFAAFGGRLGSAGGSTRRRMFDVALRRDGRLLELEFEATAFLPHQVRRTVGALVEVGRGRLTVEEFQAMLQVAAPGVAGPAAPPHGLCLVAVRYDCFDFHAAGAMSLAQRGTGAGEAPTGDRRRL